ALHAADRVGHLPGDVLTHRAGDRARHLLDDGVGHLLADGVGHLGADALADVGRRGHLLADLALLPDPTGAGLVGGAAGHADAAARLVVRLAGARVEAALAGGFLPDVVRPARLAVGLGAPLANPAADRPAGRHRPADGLDALLVARLDALTVAGRAHVPHDALGDRPADGRADGLVAGLVARPADGRAALAAVLLADLLGDLVAGHVAVLLVHRPADR